MPQALLSRMTKYSPTCLHQILPTMLPKPRLLSTSVAEQHVRRSWSGTYPTFQHGIFLDTAGVERLHYLGHWTGQEGGWWGGWVTTHAQPAQSSVLFLALLPVFFNECVGLGSSSSTQEAQEGHARASKEHTLPPTPEGASRYVGEGACSSTIPDQGNTEGAMLLIQILSRSSSTQAWQHW